MKQEAKNEQEREKEREVKHETRKRSKKEAERAFLKYAANISCSFDSCTSNMQSYASAIWLRPSS